MRIILLVILLTGCNALKTHEKPRDITCSAKCSECKEVEMNCHGISKSEDNESVSVQGK
jgi:hypothetical protein